MSKIVGIAMVFTLLFTALPTRAQDKPILAVMEIEDNTKRFEPADLNGVREYLSTLLVASGLYQVVDKSRHSRKREAVVRRLKRKSHDPCYDDRCRVELGRELAADSLLTCSIVGFGSLCAMNCQVVPLEKAVADKAGTAEFACKPAGIPAAVKSVVVMLGGTLRASQETSPAEAAKVEADTAIGAEDKAGRRLRLPEIVGKSKVKWVYSAAAGVYLSRSEVTVGQFAACVAAGACRVENVARGQDCNLDHPTRSVHPVLCTNWYAAKEFCDWVGGRLPSDAEWYAEASNGTERRFPWGDDEPTCEHAVWGQRQCGVASSAPVCSRPKGLSAAGLCDMAGNASEWTDGSKGTDRTLRGGNWQTSAIEHLESEGRGWLDLVSWKKGGGFRCARDAR